MILITDIVNFILRYRGNSNAFKGGTKEQIYSMVHNAMGNNCIVVDSDGFGCIRGVIVGDLYPSDRRLHILGLLAVRSNSVRKFAEWLQLQTTYDGYHITATRRGKAVQYDTVKLLNKLTNKKDN